MGAGPAASRVTGASLTGDLRPAQTDAMATSTQDPGVVDALTLAALYGDEVLLGTARDTHRAVADRIFGLLGPLGRVPRVIHDGVSTGVYGGLGLGLAGAAKGLGAVSGGPRLAPGVHSAIAGIVGDRLRDDDHPMHFEMGVRLRGESVPVDPAHLAAAYPGATDKVVVFLHGLCETESYWHREDRPSYGQTLATQGWTPVFLRYNTGLSIRENGVALAALLCSLSQAWPTDVRRIALVGHSLGGLVIRSACVVAAEERWQDRVSDVVMLGSPHLGAPLARQAKAGGALLKLIPEAAAFGRIIDHRSVGILDLECELEADNLEHIDYRIVSGQMRGLAGLLLGDLLVSRDSASGRVRGREAFPGADAIHLADTHHFGLLNHPDVHEKLKEWLA